MTFFGKVKNRFDLQNLFVMTLSYFWNLYPYGGKKIIPKIFENQNFFWKSLKSFSFGKPLFFYCKHFQNKKYKKSGHFWGRISLTKEITNIMVEKSQKNKTSSQKNCLTSEKKRTWFRNAKWHHMRINVTK